MAITQLNDYGVGDFNLTAIINTIGKTYKGKADITISEYDTTAAPDVKVGSVFENNGAIFIVDTSDITPTGYAGISNSTTFYLYFDESGTTFIYSSTAPTWSDSLQGWYNGNDRALFSMYKDSGGTLYEDKTRIQQESAERFVKGRTFTTEIFFKNHYKSSSISEADLFDILDSWVPTTAKVLPCDGILQIGGGQSIIHGLLRHSGTEIRVGYIAIGTTTLVYEPVIDGGGTTFGIEIMSNYDEL